MAFNEKLGTHLDGFPAEIASMVTVRPGTATNLDVYPGIDWVSVILSNYDTLVNPIITLERRLITQLGAAPAPGER